MYIEPNTDIYLLHNVDLDNTYNNTVFFDTIAEQTEYFSSKIIPAYGRYTNATYQRKERGYIRVGVPIGRIFDCNYIMYKNTNFENKWIYAFVTAVNYINNEVTEIQFEIDVIQTWYFDITWQQVFIEREHVQDDTIGRHTLPEPVNLGDYFVCVDQADFLEEDEYDMTDWTILVISSLTADITVGDNPVKGSIIDGFYTGCTVYPVRFNNLDTQITNLDNYLGAMVADNKVESIVACVMIPTCFINPEVFNHIDYSGKIPIVDWNSQQTPLAISHGTPIARPDPSNNDDSHIAGAPPLNTIDGYVPSNNKLFTFPYNYLYVINTVGEGHEYRWEAFDVTNVNYKPSFRLFTNISATPEMSLVPMRYKGQPLNYDELVPISDFPMISFSYDSFKAWVAAGGAAKTAISIAGHAAGVVTGGVTMAMAGEQQPMLSQGLGATLGGAVGIAGDITDAVIEARKPNILSGSYQSNLMVANRMLGFKCMSMQVRQEIAIQIDKFFNRYGYAVNLTRIPRFHNRRWYTYVKTQNCDISGNIPVDDKRRICQIMDAGITWWTKDANIGDYNVVNMPLG